MPCDLIRDKLICVKEWQYHRLKRTMWLPCLKDENYFRCRVCHSISNVPKTPELADDGDWISWIKNYNFGGSKNDLNVKMCQDIRENLTLFLLQSSSIILLHLSFNIHQFHKIISIFEPFIRSNMTWSLLDALYLPGKREFIPDSCSLSLFSVNAKDQFWVLSVTRKIQYTFTTLNHLKT